MSLLHTNFPVEELSRAQYQFFYSLVRNVAFIGGFGSGKTLIACMKAVFLSQIHSGLPGIVVSPTFRMMNMTVLPTMFDSILAPMGLLDHCKWRSSDKILTMPWNSVILFASAERPSRLRGPNLAWGIMDEATIVDNFYEAYISLSTRLRHVNATRHPETGRPLFHLGVTGTPEGRLDELYDRFYKPPEDKKIIDQWRNNTQVIQSSSLENPGLDPSVIDELFSIISEDMRAAHIYGQFIDLAHGCAYYSFQEDTNVRSEAVYDPTLPLGISWDFNVDPMVATIYQVLGGRLVMCIDEVVIKRSNTPSVCKEIIKRYGKKNLNHTRRIVIYGDASGGRTTAEKSDYDVIVEYLGEYFGYEKLSVKVPSKNPGHHRRLHSVNAMFRNASGNVGLYINPKCKTLIKDLKHQSMDGTSKNKRQMVGGEILGHASDTLDYFIDKEFPYKRPNSRIDFRRTSLNNWDKMPSLEAWEK